MLRLQRDFKGNQWEKLCFHYKSVYKFCFLCISPLPSSPVHWLQVNIACAHCSHKHKEMHFFTRVLTAKMPILFHTKDLGAHTQGEKTCEMIHSIQPRVQDDKFCFTRTQHLCHRLLDHWQHFPRLKTKGHANTHVTAVTKTI